MGQPGRCSPTASIAPKRRLPQATWPRQQPSSTRGESSQQANSTPHCAPWCLLRRKHTKAEEAMKHFTRERFLALQSKDEAAIQAADADWERAVEQYDAQ